MIGSSRKCLKRMTADSYLNLNVRLQYIQYKQEVISTDRFGVHIGPSGDFSDIQAGMSGMRSKPAVPWHPVYVSVAATTDVPVMQFVLPSSARKRHSPSNYELQERSIIGRSGSA